MKPLLTPGVDAGPITDEASHTVTTTFEVRPVGYFQIVKRVTKSGPLTASWEMNGEVVCQCRTEDEAKRLAGLLADAMT